MLIDDAGVAHAEIVPLPAKRTDAELVGGLRRRLPWAQQLLFERYGAFVERTVRRVLGTDYHVDLADVIHDVFIEAFSSAHTLKNAEAISGWIRSVATHTACNTIRRRKSRAWLRFFAPDELPEPPQSTSTDAKEAHDRTYRLLSLMPVDERVAFVLRFIEGMELREVAEACRVSLATIKRRIARAERSFLAEAKSDPVLVLWLEKGDRWSQ
jgi:RNA polymerase sigma-70 factor (ECF subfamily)